MVQFIIQKQFSIIEYHENFARIAKIFISKVFCVHTRGKRKRLIGSIIVPATERDMPI
jgi:hypothetical protein